MFDADRPIFQQLADAICAQILDGSYPEDSQVPSTNEFAAFYRINPATAGKGVNRLVDEGVLYKRRGIGMFVAPGARERLRRRRREDFAERFVRPLAAEASALHLAPDEVLETVRAELVRSAPEIPTRQETAS